MMLIGKVLRSVYWKGTEDMGEKFLCTEISITRNFVGRDTSIRKVISDNEG